MQETTASDLAAPFTQNAWVERRLVGRALAAWEKLRQERPFPRRDDCIGAGIRDFAPSAFLIRIEDREERDRVVDCGPVLRDALGADPVGLPAGRVLPSATERGLIIWRVAAEFKTPIVDVGSFTNPGGREILYRSVLLPLSDDQERIDHLLGAFSFRYVS